MINVSVSNSAAVVSPAFSSRTLVTNTSGHVILVQISASDYVATMTQRTIATAGIEAYPSWLRWLAFLSFVCTVAGFVADLVATPTPYAVAFPIGLTGVWLTYKLSGRYDRSS